MRLMLLFAAAAIVGVPAVTHAADTDAQIRQKIIRASITSYPGTCPCPYNVMRNGRSCGGRSAYSRPGGYAPKCYPNDVSAAEVEEYRRSH